MKKYCYLWVLMLLITTHSQNTFAQKTTDKKWDVSNPKGEFNFKEATFSTDEGTWLNLDVSPDGKTIVFDLLGDIYKMPFGGGEAQLLRGGLPFEVQPRFSPDGKKILFTSDAGGGDNCWTMNADGSNPQQITKEDFRLLNNGVWLSNEYIVARKHFTSGRSLGAGELWQYHITGGAGLQLTERKNDQQDVNEPSPSPDGKYIYYSEDMYGGGFFQYNKDPNSQIFVIKRYDRETGKSEDVIGGVGGACRPQVSHDGKKLAYIRRVRTQTWLCLYDLETGLTTDLYGELSKDQQEAWTIFGVYTGFAWTPDDKNIVIWAKGKIRNIEIATKKATEIPFKVQVKQQLGETLQFQNKVFEDKFKVRVIRHALTTPDDKTLIFNAVGYLWKKDLPNGEPKRLTKETDFEFEPCLSPNGNELVYVTWNDENFGAIKKIDLKSGKITTISTQKGNYRTPQYSPDAKQIVFRKEGGNEHQGFAYGLKAGLYTMSASGGEATFISARGEKPRFSADGKRIYFQTGGYLFGAPSKEFRSIKLDGSDEKTHFTSKYTNQFVPSPDEKWIAFTELHKAYIAPFPKTGKAVGLSADTKAVPVALVGKDAGYNLHWSSDSKRLHWTLGEAYFTDELTERFKFLEGAKDSLPPVDSVGIAVNLQLPYDKPNGKICFENVRIITMEGDEVIENGFVLVEQNKILKVGKIDPNNKDKALTIDGIKIRGEGIKTMNCEGKTMMPGIVDVHAHLGEFRYGNSSQKKWEYFANLAYGVTTSHDPSANSEMIFSHSEMVKAGNMIGPRVYSTGTILYGAEGDFKAVINSLDDARSALRRTKAFGAFSLKSYNQPRREQRQQIVQAARELNMLVVTEGGSFFYHNLTHVIDGNTGVEHNLPIAPLYNDVIQLWKNSKAHNTPTLIVNYGAMNGENYWYQKTEVWKKARLMRFTPRPVVDAKAIHRTAIPDEEYEMGHILTAQSSKKMQDNGINVNLGAHGQLQGLGAHWELWMLAQGGMSNLQAIRCATLNGAKYLGMETEIGSIKAGKLADLIIMDKNPLENIQHSETVRYTMINGRLFDCETMHEIGGEQERKRTKFYFELDGATNMPMEMTTCGGDKCSCRN